MDAESVHGAGLSAYRNGRVEEAAALLQQAVERAPGEARFHCNLGVVLEETGEAEAAIRRYRRAVELDPQMHEAQVKLGHALSRTGALAEACAALCAAIRLRCDAGTVNDLGVLLARLDRHEAAAACYRQALALDGGHAGAHCNRAAALNKLGLFEEARQSAERSLALRPKSVEALPALLNLGNAHREQGRFGAAAECYERAAELAPADPGPWNNLGEARREQGRIAEARASYEQALAVRPNDAVAWSNLLYLHAFSRDISPTEELALARGWEQAMLSAEERGAARRAAMVGSGVFDARPREGRRLRVGIVSAELGTHAVAEFLKPFLEELDRERFHLTLLPTVGRTEARAATIRRLADEYVPLMGVPDAAAVERIRGLGIDVLIDTSGHTVGNRLGVFARRAAPVQCSWIGYWSTTGLTEMDYALADAVAPAGAEAHFSERLWRLERADVGSALNLCSPLNLCYRGDVSLETAWEPDADGTVWLGSLNRLGKIREESIALWAGALRLLPEARLLLEDRGGDETESHVRLRQGFAGHEIAPERVEFVPYVPGHERHMRLYDRLDIALDTVPFNSGTTAFDALWMGVPLVTVEGDWTGGRIAGGVLRGLGRPEWIAQDAADFAERVRDLARDVPLRQRLRGKQRAEMLASSLCDAAGLTRAVEAALLAMHDRWLRGE